VFACESDQMVRTLTFTLLLAAACGGKDKAAPASPTPMPGSGQHADGEHHANLPPDVNAFHELLRPLWHAEMGDKRRADTCAAAPQMTSNADAIGKSVPPQTANADRWTAATKGLVEAVPALDAACKSGDAAKFETAFSGVHDAFHALMQASREMSPSEPAPMGGGQQGSGGGGGGGHDHGGHHH
jgi:hypothetical protein